MDRINVIDQSITDRYALYNGDSAEILEGIPSNSIHYSIFSPPICKPIHLLQQRERPGELSDYNGVLPPVQIHRG